MVGILNLVSMKVTQTGFQKYKIPLKTDQNDSIYINLIESLLKTSQKLVFFD